MVTFWLFENYSWPLLKAKYLPLVRRMSMEMSFFTLCPLTGGLSVPLQTVRTSNSSLSSRAFVRVRRFVAAYRLVFVRPALERTPGILSVYGIASHFLSYLLMPYNPGLGQGHGKKRHLHAHSPVNFKELKCYE